VDTVIRTEPVAETSVDDGSAVTVVVSSGPPPLVVPKVAGLKSDDAITRLEQVGLASTITQQTSSEVRSRIVIRTEPPAGSEVDRGDAVEIVVSCGEFCID
jgi:beta-lactam-binding protein with PASTA domain